MKLVRLTLCNFQSFGPKPTTVEMRDVTFVLGPTVPARPRWWLHCADYSVPTARWDGSATATSTATPGRVRKLV